MHAGKMYVSSGSWEEYFCFLTKNVYVMLRGGLYNKNAVSENMSHSYSNIVKNLAWKQFIIFPSSPTSSPFSL